MTNLRRGRPSSDAAVIPGGGHRLDRSRWMTRCHLWNRAAGCRTRGYDNQRFRPKRWTFARNLEGHTHKEYRPGLPPGRGSTCGTRPRESDEPRCTLTAKQLPEMPCATNPPVVRPKAMNPPLLFPDHVPEGSWSLDADATPNRIPPGWWPVTSRSCSLQPDKPVGRARRPVTASLSGPSLFDPKSLAPRKRHPPGRPRTDHLGEWSCLSPRHHVASEDAMDTQSKATGSGVMDPGVPRPKGLETPFNRQSVSPGNQGIPP